MLVNLNKVRLAMFQRLVLPKRKLNPATNLWEKDGDLTEERTIYTLRDEFGDTLEVIGKNDFRSFEGKDVNVQLDVVQKEFQGKKTTKLAIGSITEPI